MNSPKQEHPPVTNIRNKGLQSRSFTDLDGELRLDNEDGEVCIDISDDISRI